jgi:hypothetical protein
MRRYDLEGMRGSGLGVLQGGVANRVVLAGSAFVLGLVTGMVLKDLARQMYRRTRNGLWDRDYERTVEYSENLPESLARREPAPESSHPRYGGTGALGVSPAAVHTARQEENK